jgi:3-hydroxyacyl-[acyl-carrier-protein] dehydratase
MPETSVDLSRLDLNKVVMTRAQVYQLLPQRYQFELIGGVLHLDPVVQEIITFVDFKKDDWWAAGHLPGRPLVPGIVMMEAAAQTAALLMREVQVSWRDKFIGFGGLDGVRFRGMITPPARVLMIAKGGSYRSNLAKMPIQGVQDGKLVFSGEVLGVLI